MSRLLSISTLVFLCLLFLSACAENSFDSGMDATKFDDSGNSNSSDGTGDSSGGSNGKVSSAGNVTSGPGSNSTGSSSGSSSGSSPATPKPTTKPTPSPTSKPNPTPSSGNSSNSGSGSTVSSGSCSPKVYHLVQSGGNGSTTLNLADLNQHILNGGDSLELDANIAYNGALCLVTKNPECGQIKVESSNGPATLTANSVNQCAGWSAPYTVGMSVQDGGSNVLIQNIHLVGNKAAYGFGGGTLSNIVLANMTFSNFTTGNQEGGVAVAFNTSKNIIVQNSSFESNDFGIVIFHGSDTALLQNLKIEYTNQTGIWIEDSSNVTVKDSIIHDSGNASAAHFALPVGFMSGNSDHLLVAHNEIYNTKSTGGDGDAIDFDHGTKKFYYERKLYSR